MTSPSNELVQEFRRSADGNIAALKSDFDAVLGDGPDAAGAIGRMLATLHVMRGQGTSFGYPLITEIAGNLDDFLHRLRPPIDQTQMETMRHHLSALDLVLNRDIRGKGGDSGARLIATLQRLTHDVPPTH